jgi:hypothetical protein
MMDDLLYGLLSQSVGITALVGTRISPVRDVTPGETRDRLVYRQIGGYRDYDCDGQGLAHGRYHITAWSRTHAGAAALSEAVRAALSGYRGDDIKMILIENQGDIESMEPDETATEYGKYIELVIICKEA